jgi:thioredoxin reductase (NADPH)
MRMNSHRSNLEIGGIRFGSEPEQPPTREKYLKYLESVVRTLELPVQTHTEALGITSGVPHTVQTRDGSDTIRGVNARNVVIASGGFLRPVLLGIPGEHEEMVSHYFDTEALAHGTRVLVVGGRNSAVEAAIHLVKRDATVTLAYRGGRLPRKSIKSWLLPDLDRIRRNGAVRIYYSTVPVRISNGSVELLRNGDAAVAWGENLDQEHPESWQNNSAKPAVMHVQTSNAVENYHPSGRINDHINWHSVLFHSILISYPL